MTEWVSDAALKLYKIIKFYYVLVTLAPLFWLTDSHLYLVTPVTIKLWLFKKSQAKKLKFDEGVQEIWKKERREEAWELLKNGIFPTDFYDWEDKGFFKLKVYHTIWRMYLS